MFRIIPHRTLTEPRASLAHLDAMGNKATAVLHIEGLVCSVCAARVQNHLERVDGVSSVRVDLERGEARVEYDATCATPDTLIGAVEGAALLRSLRRVLAAVSGHSRP